MKGYWEIIEKNVRQFSKRGDRLVCRSVSLQPRSACELCGYHPVFWVYSLWNPRTGEELAVGGKCVVNAKEAFLNVYGEGLLITFPEMLRKYADGLNELHPGAVQVLKLPEIDSPDLLDEHQEDLQYQEESWRESIREEYGSDLAPDGLGGCEIDWEALDYE
jgi:hypothetical protein